MSPCQKSPCKPCELTGKRISIRVYYSRTRMGMLRVFRVQNPSWIAVAYSSPSRPPFVIAAYAERCVISERNILSIENAKVTFRYTDNTGSINIRTLSGADFLWHLLQHVLPIGFRRARDYGFLHANSKAMIRLIQRLFNVAIHIIKKAPRAIIHCQHCGGEMAIIATRIRPRLILPEPMHRF